MGMAYDAARNQVVLHGGVGNGAPSDTWTWDGTDWTQRAPAHHPLKRYFLGMTYDAARGQVVLFGGDNGNAQFPAGDTWTWDGTDWSVPGRAWIKLKPSSGPANTVVEVKGRDFGAYLKVALVFIDSTQGAERLVTVTTDGTGSFNTHVTIPDNATPGEQHVKAWAHDSGQFRKRTFTVT
jgi:hypothetical protein